MASDDRYSRNETRKSIESYIYANPGVHFNDLVRELGLATGQVQYHVRRLSKAKSLIECRHYGRTHYYPPSFDEWERGVLALARRETAREIILFLLEREAVKPVEVVEALPIARSTLEWQIERLVEQGIVEKRYNVNNRVSLVIIDPDRVLKLLERASPSIPDQLADRFVRFVDEVFDGS